MTTSARQHAARIARTTATRTRRVTASIWRYAKAHLPKWLLGVLAACLVIPGPLDEIAVLLVLAAIILRSRRNRLVFARYMRTAWRLDGAL